MRGVDHQQSRIFRYLSPETRVRKDHPLRPAGISRADREGEADPLFAVEYEPAGGSHRTLRKVGKETIFGLLKALEMFVNEDFDAILKIYDERAQVITDAVKKFGVTALPPQFNAQSKFKITGEIMQRLADRRPIGIGSMGAGASGMRGRNPDAPPR